MSSAAPAPIGVVAHYNLLERLEPAGPGDLFRARDTRFGRTVAVRLLPADFLPDAAVREAFVDRARTLASLSHPNATTLFDVGQHDSRVFIAFEFLTGQSLRAEMAGRPMPARRAVQIAVQVADAVAEAHASGFLHGGLSPDSIVITAKGHAKIPAFHLAVREGFDETGGEVRLRDYESPEEARGDQPDERSDTYSVGAILFEMLTARRPPHQSAPFPGATNPHVPGELERVVLKAAAAKPGLRYASAGALAADLRGVGAAMDARGGGDEAPEGDGASSGATRSATVGVMVLILLVFMVWWFAIR